MTQFPKTLLLLGSGELGKEITIAAQRLGCKVIACDRYANAPAMQVAHESEVFDMSNETTLKNIIYKKKPDIVIPEIEALAVNALAEIEEENITVIPNARATSITMNRDKIRDLASKELKIKTARFAYASTKNELEEAIKKFELPVLIKPVMSSSGKGQSLVKTNEEINTAWEIAIQESRGKSEKVIIEEFINFDLEITLLTIREQNGETIFCDPIGHEQANGDYQCSWQPAELNNKQLQKAQEMAKIVTDNLGGVGLFGVEFFIAGEEVIFSELSPRPHDTGLVTIVSQELNEFELHLSAILGLPIPKQLASHPSASRVILSNKYIKNVGFKGVEKALENNTAKILLFGKPNAKKGRRMGVSLAKGKTTSEAREKADHAAKSIEVIEKV